MSPLRRSWSVRASPTGGGEFREQLQGFDIGQMLTLANLNAIAGVTCDLQFEGNQAALTLTSADPAANGFGAGLNSITDKWEVGVDMEKPELFENQNFLSLFTTVNSYYGTNVDQQFFQLIKSTAEAGGEANSKWGQFCDALASTDLRALSGDVIAPTDPGTYGSALAEAAESLNTPIWGSFSGGNQGKQGLKFFCEEYFRGRTNFIHGKYVLRHTTLAPGNYSASVSEFNIEKIYSIAQLLSEAQNGALWILPLPAYLAYKIANYPVPGYMPANYTWGALKCRGNAVVAARNRIEISQEYLIDAISKPTYGVI
jgi:phage-related protein